jgi:hypothetical protein
LASPVSGVAPLIFATIESFVSVTLSRVRARTSVL